MTCAGAITVLGHPAPWGVIERALEGYSFALRRICAVLREAEVPCVVLGTLYNPVPRSPLAMRAFNRLNEIIRDTAQREQFGLARVDAVFSGLEPALIHRYRTGRLEDLSLPFGRPVHPNDLGHAHIADAFWEAIAKAPPAAQPAPLAQRRRAQDG